MPVPLGRVQRVHCRGRGRHVVAGQPVQRGAPVRWAVLVLAVVAVGKRRAARAHRPLVLVVVDRVALTVGQDGAVGLARGRAL